MRGTRLRAPDPARAHRHPWWRNPGRVAAVAALVVVVLALFAVVALALDHLLTAPPDTGPGPAPATVVIDGRPVRTVCVAPGLRGFTDPADRRLLATGTVDYGASRWGCP